MPDEPLDLDLLAASLRADLSDISAFMEGIAVKFEAAMPGSTRVERVKQGFRGPKVVQSVAIDAGGDRFELRRDVRRGGSLSALRSRVSGGIVLKTEEVGIDAWLPGLVSAVGIEAQRNQLMRQALEGLLLGSGEN